MKVTKINYEHVPGGMHGHSHSISEIVFDDGARATVVGVSGELTINVDLGMSLGDTQEYSKKAEQAVRANRRQFRDADSFSIEL